MRRAVVVVGHGAERVTKKLQERRRPTLLLDFVEQHVQRGTGDAVGVGLTAFPADELDDDEGDVLVLPGDTPLLRPATIAALVERAPGHRRRLHRADRPSWTTPPATAGSSGAATTAWTGVVEQADATPDEQAIDEVNTSIYCFRLSVLAPALRRLSPENAQGEYYLTDVVEVLADAGYRVTAVVAEDPAETQGVNDRRPAGRRPRPSCGGGPTTRWMAKGVTMVDPERTYVDATVSLAADVTLFPGTILQGRCVVGAGAEIGPDTRLVDCVVGAGAVVENDHGARRRGRRRRPRRSVRRARAGQHRPCRRPHRGRSTLLVPR